MKKVFCFFLCLIVYSSLLFSFDVYLSPIFEYRNLRLGEYVVLQNVYTESGDKWVLSQLEWQGEYVFDAGLSTEFVFKNISVLGKVVFGLPFKAGFMTDEDFFPETNSEGKIRLGNYIYSKSTIYLDHFYDLSLNLFWTPFNSNNNNDGGFKLGTSLQWKVLQFTSKNGTQYEYDETSTLVLERFLPGKGISYEQNVLLWWFDFSFSFPSTTFMKTNIYFSFSSFWYGEGSDRHYLRDEDFLDMVKGHAALKFCLEFLLKIKEQDLGFQFSYLTMPIETGASAWKPARDKYYTLLTTSLGGISARDFTASLFYRFHFEL